MDRRKFLKKSCTACLSISAISIFASSCTPTRYVGGQLVNDGLLVNKEDFKVQNGTGAYSSFIIIRNEQLKFPVCIYRINELEYTALWMRCTHQGAELQAAGDTLQCPAHGSEFNNRGKAITGPATEHLRTFPVTVNKDQLFIDMRKQS